MAKTRFFRIAVEGGTTDGRVIERSWIEQMAAGYNRASYTASINCKHIRGYSPELFARQRRPGWDAWGNDVDRFGESQ